MIKLRPVKSSLMIRKRCNLTRCGKQEGLAALISAFVSASRSDDQKENLLSPNRLFWQMFIWTPTRLTQSSHSSEISPNTSGSCFERDANVFESVKRVPKTFSSLALSSFPPLLISRLSIAYAWLRPVNVREWSQWSIDLSMRLLVLLTTCVKGTRHSQRQDYSVAGSQFNELFWSWQRTRSCMSWAVECWLRWWEKMLLWPVRTKRLLRVIKYDSILINVYNMS